MELPGPSGRGLRDTAMTAAPTLVVLVMSAVSLDDSWDAREPWLLAVLLAQALPLLMVRFAPRTVVVWTVTVDK